MKTKRKNKAGRLLAIALTLCMVLTFMPGAGFEGQGEDGSQTIEDIVDESDRYAEDLAEGIADSELDFSKKFNVRWNPSDLQCRLCRAGD